MKNDLCIWLHRWVIKMCLVFGFQWWKFQWNKKKYTYNWNVTLFPFRREEARRDKKKIERKRIFLNSDKILKIRKWFISTSGPGWRLRVIVLFNFNHECWMLNVQYDGYSFYYAFQFLLLFPWCSSSIVLRSALFTLRGDPCQW